jgi:hypothetical protein
MSSRNLSNMNWNKFLWFRILTQITLYGSTWQIPYFLNKETLFRNGFKEHISYTLISKKLKGYLDLGKKSLFSVLKTNISFTSGFEKKEGKRGVKKKG